MVEVYQPLQKEENHEVSQSELGHFDGDSGTGYRITILQYFLTVTTVTFIS
jgi:hypothetical protein